MQLRIRLQRGVEFQRKKGKNRHVAWAVAALLVPLSLMAVTLALWRLASDAGWTGQFPITGGAFSHWHVWMGTAAAGALLAYRLNRYGRGG